jgi:glycosyltransferase involved in cell wall biosynthesis
VVLLKAALLLLLNGTRVVHVQWLMDRKADLFFIRILQHLGITVVYTVHDLLPHDEYTPKNRHYYQKLYRYPAALIVHSEQIRREMLELFQVDEHKLRVIPLGCSNICFDQYARSQITARDKLGVPQDARIILSFGLIKRYKGVEYLLQAFETISSRCGNAMLLIAGTIAKRDPKAHRYYSELLARYAQRDDVSFNDEYVPLNRVADYFAASDLVVLPYVKASQSAVLLAAYAAGRPVVVTDTGGLGEVVEDGGSGFVVPPCDVGALAEAAVRLLNDREMCLRFGSRARELGHTLYSWTAIGATTANLYASLVDGISNSDTVCATPLS